jgi:hypothetical protein
MEEATPLGMSNTRKRRAKQLDVSQWPTMKNGDVFRKWIIIHEANVYKLD